MKIKYNAPVILTFAFLSTAVVILSQIFGKEAILSIFSVPGKDMNFRFLSLDALHLVTHVAAHDGWVHLLGNFTFILLIGPILEEKYGALPLLFMMLVTAVVTGLLNVLFFPSSLLGASGIVFMLILLISFTNIRSGEIPLTFILVVLLFLAKEIISIFETNNISEFAHIVGGICGGLFGFFFGSKNQVVPPAEESP
jgi:membrane associated rhomboid family serine protease